MHVESVLRPVAGRCRRAGHWLAGPALVLLLSMSGCANFEILQSPPEADHEVVAPVTQAPAAPASAVVAAAVPVAAPASGPASAPVVAPVAASASTPSSAEAPASAPVRVAAPVLSNETLAAEPAPHAVAGATSGGPPSAVVAPRPGDADYQLGREQLTAGRFDIARQALERAGALEHPAALYELAGLHAAGKGVPRDESKAFELALRAARHGWPDAMWDVADRYGAGRGVGRDLLASCVWLLRVRDQSGSEQLAAQAVQVLPYMEHTLTLVQQATCHKHAEVWPPEGSEVSMADAIQPIATPAPRQRCVTKIGKKGKKTKVCKAVGGSKAKAVKAGKTGKAGKKATSGKKTSAAKKPAKKTVKH